MAVYRYLVFMCKILHVHTHDIQVRTCRSKKRSRSSKKKHYRFTREVVEDNQFGILCLPWTFRGYARKYFPIILFRINVQRVRDLFSELAYKSIIYLHIIYTTNVTKNKTSGTNFKNAFVPPAPYRLKFSSKSMDCKRTRTCVPTIAYLRSRRRAFSLSPHIFRSFCKRTSMIRPTIYGKSV